MKKILLAFLSACLFAACTQNTKTTDGIVVAETTKFNPANIQEQMV